MKNGLVSIIVPTYREAENLPHLARAVNDAMQAAGKRYQIIVADDNSPDDTKKICAGLAQKFPLILLTREKNRGLAPAVIDGIAAADGEFAVVMDADLSHPPEKIPQLIAPMEKGEADFVIGSRHISGGSIDENWPLMRRLISRSATLPAYLLVSVRDPLSGFFALRRREMPPTESLSPVGYKIGLEILIKGNFRRVREIPIHFADRQFGKSKLDAREQWNYLRHLRRLYRHRWPQAAAFAQFCAVGGVGLAWDILFYYLMQAAGFGHWAARAISFWPAVTNNWILNRALTFEERKKSPPLSQWGKFAAASAIGFAVNWGAYIGLTSGFVFFDSNRLLALIAGVVLATAFNFFCADRWIFPREK